MYLRARQEILALLGRVAAGHETLQDFQSKFEFLYLDREGWPILDSRDKEFFSLVLEKVGWTANSPSAQERELGWIDFDSFRAWLQTSLDRYDAAEQATLGSEEGGL